MVVYNYNDTFYDGLSNLEPLILPTRKSLRPLFYSFIIRYTECHSSAEFILSQTSSRFNAVLRRVAMFVFVVGLDV